MTLPCTILNGSDPKSSGFVSVIVYAKWEKMVIKKPELATERRNEFRRETSRFEIEFS
jgi:hypothetical protein